MIKGLFFSGVVKALIKYLEERWPELSQVFFRYLESYGITPEMFFYILTIVIIGVLFYIVIDFIQIKKKPVAGEENNYKETRTRIKTHPHFSDKEIVQKNKSLKNDISDEQDHEVIMCIPCEKYTFVKKPYTGGKKCQKCGSDLFSDGDEGIVMCESCDIYKSVNLPYCGGKKCQKCGEELILAD